MVMIDVTREQAGTMAAAEGEDGQKWVDYGVGLVVGGRLVH